MRNIDYNSIIVENKSQFNAIRTNKQDKIFIYMSGSGKGTYYGILVQNKQFITISGKSDGASANQCVIYGITEALKSIEKFTDVYIVTSTQIGLKTGLKRKGTNVDKLETIYSFIEQHNVKLTEVFCRGISEVLTDFIAKYNKEIYSRQTAGAELKGTEVIIYTDGSARSNPGRGGYGTVLQFTDKNGNLHQKELSQGYRLTTNNRMEMMAAIVGLEALKKPCDVIVYSDSQYLVNAFNKNWVKGWIKKNWMRTPDEPVKNIDLWKRLLKSMEMHNVQFRWIKGHNGQVENERCDELATTAADGMNLVEDENYCL